MISMTAAMMKSRCVQIVPSHSFSTKAAWAMGNQQCIPCHFGSSGGSMKSSNTRPAHKDAHSSKDDVRIPMLRTAFEHMDHESKGFISYDDVLEFGKYCGNRHWDVELLESVFQDLSVHHKDQVTIDEFLEVCHEHTNHTSNETFKAMIQGFLEVCRIQDERRDLIKEVYKRIDVDESGTLDRDDMMDFGRFMNARFDEDKLNKLMEQMDLDGDGFVSQEEFCAYFAKLSKAINSNEEFKAGIGKYLSYRSPSAQDHQQEEVATQED